MPISALKHQFLGLESEDEVQHASSFYMSKLPVGLDRILIS